MPVIVATVLLFFWIYGRLVLLLLLPPTFCACGLGSPKIAHFAFILILKNEANQLVSVSLFRDG